MHSLGSDPSSRSHGSSVRICKRFTKIMLILSSQSMRYYTITLVMFGFVTPFIQESDQANRTRIRDLRSSSAREICTILNNFRSRWPVEYMPMTSMQYSTVSMFTLMDNLDDVQNKQAFVGLFITLRALARRWQLAKGMLRIIQLTALKMEATLPTETQVLFKDFEAELWKAEDRERFSSLYPNFAVSVNRKKGLETQVGEAELDQFLKEWDNFALSDQVKDTDK